MGITFIEKLKGGNAETLCLYSTYLSSIMDDFWETHIMEAKHYSIRCNDKEIGFFTLFSENKITAFFIEDDYLLLAQVIFHRILAEYSVKTAFVATCDELFLSLCLDFHKKVELQAYIFGVNTDVSSKIPENENADFSEIDPVDLIEINRQTEDFFADITPEQLKVKERIIFKMSDGGVTLGYGVIVQYLANPRYWGCGMVVLPEHRRKGVGGRILSRLRDICRENGKIPHSGCWYHNHLSKKTIEGIGRYSKTRLLNIQF